MKILNRRIHVFPAELKPGDSTVCFSSHCKQVSFPHSVQCHVFCIFVLLLVILLFIMAFKHSVKVLVPKHGALLSLMEKRVRRAYRYSAVG